MAPIAQRRKFREMKLLDEIIEMFGDSARTEVVDEVRYRGYSYPLKVIELGSENPEDPVIAYFGGVHGLEKIGTEVILAYMESISSLQAWDESFKKRLRHSRMLFFPMVNPVGVALRTRCNGNGVDLMRNSPSESGEETSRLYQGHRISPILPWYRGEEGAEMEIEAKAVVRVVKEKIFPSKMAMTVDIHSGFGAKDRFWFPYSRRKDIFPHIGQVMALKDLFDKTYPHHFYTIEPTSNQYSIDGDLWDHLTDEYFNAYGDLAVDKKFYLPWCLEMGSWNWLRKNPLQILNRFGLYHPLIPHRFQRILRRHLTLFDFLQRSILFTKPWLKLKKMEQRELQFHAKELWYAS